ncbi:hypothetical protein [Rhodococcus sp. ACT016]|uniref:hypothetical protein n=1 Tax=Rhodococcus sp. ACT016 TaxID=3134808 RepID=UPI003D2808B3
MKQQAPGGRHRRRPDHATVAVAVPLAISIACAGAGVAQAAPSQPGVTVDEGQPGVSAPSGDQPGVTPAPAPAPEREYVPGYTPQYAQAPSKPVYNYNYGNDANYSGGGQGYYSGYSNNYAGYSAPVYSAPAPVEDPAVVAVVEAPVKKVRLGDYIADQTDLLPENQWNQINNTAADLEAGFGQFWRSSGVDAARADRIAAASVATGAAGAVIGAGIGAIPGALLGGTIGGNVGLGMGGFVSLPLNAIPIPGLPTTVIVPTTVAGTAVGAAAGAAVGAAVLAVPFAAAGVAVGAATGAGDPLDEPHVVELPSKPRADQEAIAEQTRQVVSQVEALLGGDVVVDAVRTAAVEVPKLATQADKAVRGVVTAQPGGDEAAAAFDSFVADVAPFASILGDAIGETGLAINTGLTA